MKEHSKVISVLLTIALVLGLLPLTATAQGTVSGEELRANVVARTQAIMNVDWSLQSRIAKGNIKGEELEAWKAGGIIPTTYFEYSRLHFPYKGVMVQGNPATMEEFAAMGSLSAAVVEGIPHNLYSAGEQKGMDINSFLTDITTHVLETPLAGLKQALADEQLAALAQGANLSAASSAAAISYEAAKAGYTKLDKGDLLLAWDDQASAVEGGKPRIHAMVVKEVNGEQVTVMYPAFSLVLWYFRCSKCALVETEGPTSAALPEHIASDGYSFGSLKKHEGCGGEWTPMYGTTWRTETVGFDALYGHNGAVPYGSKGYLPYTLKAYDDGVMSADISVNTDINKENYLAGFKANVVSDWPITSVKAVITRESEVIAQVNGTPSMGSKEYAFSDAQLDDALRRCPAGTSNTLNFYVRSGPMDAQQVAQDCYRQVFSMDFTVQQDAAKLIADKAYVQQGEQFSVSITAAEAGITGLQAKVYYDADSYAFESDSAKAVNPGVAFTDNGSEIVCTRYGNALDVGEAAATLVFHAKRTGEFPIQAQDNGQIYCMSLLATNVQKPTQADLKVSKPDATPIQLAVGYNTIVYKDYAGGHDLLVLFTSTLEQKNNTTSSALKMTYDGKPMYDVTAARYETGEGEIQRIYAVIASEADPAKLGVGEAACQVLDYDLDVNCSGNVDLNDVQVISNIIKGNLPLAGNEAKWFMADVNRDGKVDVDDMTTLWNKLLG